MADLLGGTSNFDMQAFAAQSERKTIETMQLNQRQADMAAIKELHTSMLKQQQDNNKSVSDLAKVPADEGRKAAQAFKD